MQMMRKGDKTIAKESVNDQVRKKISTRKLAGYFDALLEKAVSAEVNTEKRD